MSYFNFDLQLFANAVTVDLSTLKNTLTTATKYLVNGEWQDTAPEAPATADATLTNGVLTVTAAADAEVVLTGVKTEDLAGVQVVRTVAGKITVGDDGSIASAKSLLFTANGIVANADNVDVSAAGVVSGLEAGGTFSVYTDMSDTLPTTYTVGAAPDQQAEDQTTTLSVSGDKVGAYKGVVLSDNEGASTITLGANGAVTVTPSSVATANIASLPLTPGNIAASTPLYYAITLLSGGSLAIGSGTDAEHKETDKVLGYYKVTYNPNNNLNANVTVELVGTDGETAATMANGLPISINASGVAQINSVNVTAITVATGITTGKVSVTGVPTTANVTVGGTEYKTDVTDSNTVGISYTKSYVVNNAGNLIIDLSQAVAGDNYYVIETDDAQDHGKQKCSIATVATTDNVENKSAFKVTVNNGSYTVAFVPGTDDVTLTDAGWQNIVVDASAVDTGNTLTINSAGTDGTKDTTQDSYTVKNAKIDTTVTLVKNESDNPQKSDASKLKVERVAGSNVATTLEYKKQNGDVLSGADAKISLPSTGTEYWLVTKDAETGTPVNTGNPKITIQANGTAVPASTASYIAVTKDAAGNVTVTYHNNAGIALTGLYDNNNNQTTEHLVRVALDKGSLKAGNTLTITDTNANGTVDYAVGELPGGVKVVGAGANDIIGRAANTATYDGNVTLTLNGVTGTKYYTVTEQLNSNDQPVVDPETGLTKLVVAEYTPTDQAPLPANTGYFTVTNTDGNYSVEYTVNDGIDLGNETKAFGSTTINADGVANTANINLSSHDANNKVSYKVTNVTTGGTGIITVDTENDPVTDDSAYVTYAGTEYALAAAAKITIPANGTAYYLVDATTPARGVITYTIADTSTGSPDAAKSYFKVSYSDDGKTATIEFKEGTTGVKAKDFAQNISTQIPVIAGNLGEDVTTLVTTLVLTPDSTTDGSIAYNVTGLPNTVTTVVNSSTDDSINYTPTYQFAEDGNNIALNGAAGKIYYYEVTATGGDTKARGIYTCTIKAGKEIAEKDLAGIKAVNYFKVVTDANGNPTITYHTAEATDAVKNPTVLVMDGGLEVAVDPTNAGETATITCGGTAQNDNGSFHYVVNGLSKGQTAVDGDGDNTGANSVEFAYNVSYTFGTSKLALTLSAGEVTTLANGGSVTKYYAVTRTDGSTTTTAGKGIVNFTIADTALTTAPAISGNTGAYFMVKYSSEYQVNVTYVNPTGERFDLTVDGVPQVTVDADNLSANGAKIDTINVADTTGGDYNGVNYALTNVPAGIAVVDTSKEGGVLDSKDTVSYKNIAILDTDSKINLTTDAVRYYAVTGTETNGVITCTVDAAGTTTKPADTVNYFTAAKDSSGNYTIKYQMANGTGYAFNGTDANSLNINAAGVVVAPNEVTTGGKTTASMTGVNVVIEASGVTGVHNTVTNAAGGVTATGATISYSTTFAWKPGTYYIPVEDNIIAAAGVTSGATVAGDSNTKYVVVTVETSTDKDGKVTYKATTEANEVTATGSNGTMQDTGNAAPALAITLDKDIAIFDATSTTAYTAINGVTAGDTLTNVATTTVITTDKLKANDEVTIDTTTFKAGADGAITFTGAKVTDGVILLDAENATVTESGTTGTDDSNVTSAVKLTTVGNGVKVGFTNGQISSIVGLEVGEQIVVTEGGNPVTYGYKAIGNVTYLVRVAGTNAGDTTYAAVPQNPATADLMKINFSATTAQAVGTLNTTQAGDYYLDLGTSATADNTLAVTTEGTAQAGHYYAKVTTGATNTLASISIVKGNSAGLVDNTTEYTGTITVPAGLFGAINYTGTPDTPYKVAFTGVTAGTFSNMDADDTITTAELDNNASITVNGSIYKPAGAAKQVLTFKGNALTSGTVTLDSAAGILIAADGKTVAYTPNGNDQTDGVTVVFGANGITSITGLTNGEKVTLTARDADGKITSTTTYTADATGANVTRVVEKDGQVVTDTLNVPFVENNQTNILDAVTSTGKELATTFAFATQEGEVNKTVGYIAKTSGEAAGSRVFDIPVTDPNLNEVALAEGVVVLKAESKLIDGKMHLTITPMVSDANGNLTATKPYGDTVNVAAPTQPIIFTQSTVYKVAFTNVAAGSNITANQEGTTIETVNTLTGSDSIVVNGQTIATAAAGTESIKLYIANESDVRVVNGTIAVDGTRKGESNDAKLVDTVTYTEGAQHDDGVVVTYANGKARSITGLEEGEQVVVQNGNVTTTYKAAKTLTGNTVIWGTVTGSATAADNVTKVVSVTTGSDVVGAAYQTLNPLTSTAGFSTKYDSTATATATGYFLVKDGQVTIADVAKGTTIATYENVGDTLIRANIASDGTLTLQKTTVLPNGYADTTTTALAAGDKLNVTVAVTDAQTIKYTKTAGVDTIAITGAGKGSEITGVAAGDTITTAKLTAGDTVKIGGTTYTAGADGAMVFDGTAVKSGTFKIAASLNASTFDDTSKVKTANVIKYTGSTATGDENDGVNVKIADGMVESITGLWQGETVSYTQTVTAKDGSKTEKVVTYVAGEVITSGAYNGSIKVTKTETVNGDSTIYTQAFEKNADITKGTGWAVQSASTTTSFNFGDTENGNTATGYFEAKPNDTANDPNKGKYSATIKSQSSDTDKTLDASNAGYYLKVTATKGTAGNVTFTEMTLVQLKSNGAWAEVTDKELYQVSVTAPENADIKLADHDFTVAITAKDSDSKFSNLNADDTVTANTLTAGKYLVVNNKKYTAAETGAINVKGDTLVSGTVKVEAGNVLTSNADGSTIEFSVEDGVNNADGVKVAFDKTKGITSIKDLEAGEIVTVTAKDGTVTTYERTDATNTVFTKTVTTKDGQTTEWTYTSTGLIDDATTTTTDVTTMNYGVDARFSWPADGKDSVGYFKVGSPTPATAVISETAAGTHTVADTEQIVRMEVAREGSTFTIKSLKLLKGTTLKDVTGVERLKTANAATPISVFFEMPTTVDNAKIAFDGAVVLPAASADNMTVDRNVALFITNAKKGQVYTGLADIDKVTTVDLQANEGITVNGVAYAAAEPGALSVMGDGTAYSGGFKLANGYVVKGLKNDASGTKVEVSMTSGDAMVTVVGGQVKSIYKLNAGETVTVTETDEKGLKTTVTYTGSAGEEGKITVTRTTVKDGVTTIEAASIQDGEDVLGGSAVYSVLGNQSGVTSQFNWKQANGSGYFQLTDSDGKLLATANPLSVATQSKTTITANDAGEIYAKVSLSADNKLDGISLYKVNADGTLTAVDKLADDQPVNIVITAPAEALTADLTTALNSVNSVQIVGAAAESVITLRKGDSLTTASLTAASKEIKVNGKTYEAGDNTVLKFVKDDNTTDAVLQDGIVELAGTQSFKAAGAKLDEASDNITVSFNGSTTTTPAETAVVTVVNGVVTNIVGKGQVNVSSTAGTAAYTYNSTINAYNVVVTPAANTEVTTAKLANGAALTIGGVAYKSGAADNRVTIRNEGGTNKLYNGTVTLLTQANSLTVSDGDDKSTDDVRVTYTASTAAAGQGTATVKVVNGKIQSITGLQAGETLTVTDNSVDGTTTTTTYEATAIGVKRTVVTQVGTADPITVTDNATLLAGGDLLTANYYSGTIGDNDTSLVGQFSWSKDVAGRAIGYFAVTTDKNGNIKAAVSEQPTEVVITPPKKNSKTYLVASAQYDDTVGVEAVRLTLGGLLTIDATGTVKTTAIDSSALTTDSVITINAPAEGIVFDKPATNVNITLKNLAAGSNINGLISGDVVTTATLKAGDSVTVGGNAYTAAAKGALTFIGEGAVTTVDGTVTAGTDDNKSGAALLSGTINLAGGQSGTLAGNTVKNDTGKSDDITVTNNNGGGNVVVKVANGVVSSITGLNYGYGGNVTVRNATFKSGSGKNAVVYSGATIVYTAINADSTMIMRQVFKDADNSGSYNEGDSLYDASFLTVQKTGGEIYTGAYKAASYTPLSNLSFKAGDKATTTKAYYDLSRAYDSTTGSYAVGEANMVTATNAATWDDTTVSSTNEFLAVPGKNYLVVTATTKAGVTTIKSADVYTAGANGALTKNTKTTSATGTLTISGTQGMSTAANATYDEKYAVINCALPSNNNFHVVVSDVSYKSKFTNLRAGDLVTTAALENETALSSGTYNIYYGNTNGNRTDVRTITVKTGKNDNVVVTTNADDGTLKTLTGLASKGEKVTLTTLTAEGLATTVYELKAAGVVTRTMTLADGTKSVATAAVTDKTDYVALADDAWTSTASNTIAADFDWTLQKNTTGYFKVANNAATAKVQKTTIKANDTASYVAVTVSDNGVVESVAQVRYDAESGTMKATTDDKFSGKLTLTAPTAYALSFNRATTNLDENAAVAIKGAITGSVLSNLANNDTVTTAKLKKGGYVAVNGEYYNVAGNGGALGFKVQDVSINGEDKTSKVTLTSGTALLNHTATVDDVAGSGFIYVGNSNLIEVTQGSSLTVTATTNAKGVSSFTIGDLDENESFKVNGYEYAKSGTNLVRKYNDAAGAEVIEIFANKGAKTVTSANLNKAGNWKAVAETLQTDETTNAQTSQYGVVTANLALADSRIAADKKNKLSINNYNYVLDKYVNSNTKTSATKALNGYVVASDVNWQSKIGTVTLATLVLNAVTNTTTTTYTYSAEGVVGQAIKVAANWIVNGSAQDDTITGAAKGTNTITVGAGNDTVNLGGASETVVVDLADNGQNKVNNYASGKDELTLKYNGTETGDFAVALGSTKADSGNVYLYNDADSDGVYDADGTEGSVMLKGMGNGKAVTINDKHFYFGNGYTSTKGATFAYEDGAYYVGNTSQKNGLKVTTDKTKYTAKTLGDDVVIDLMAVDAEGHNYYNNINTVDASASANRVVLSASTDSNANITLKGGTYESTLKSGASNDTLQGGSGKDMFWFEDLSGNDTIKSYTSGKDAVYVGGNTDLQKAGYTVQASGKDVIISNGDNKVTIAGAVNAAKAITVSKDGKIGGESVSYFVGKTGAKVANTFTYVDGAYYVGNSDTKDATSTKYLDTLKVTGTVKTTPTAKTVIDLSDASKYQSIEAVDASTLKAGKNVVTDKLGVDVTASANGTRFTGTAYADSFTCGDGKDYIVYKKGQGNDTIAGFGVDDVVKLNGLSKTEIANLTSQISKINSTGSGTLTIGSNKLEFSNATANLSIASNGTITGVKKG